MKRRNYKGRELLPLAVSDAARAGGADAAEQVLRYYEGYINKLGRFTTKAAVSTPAWTST